MTISSKGADSAISTISWSSDVCLALCSNIKGDRKLIPEYFQKHFLFSMTLFFISSTTKWNYGMILSISVPCFDLSKSKLFSWTVCLFRLQFFFHDNCIRDHNRSCSTTNSCHLSSHSIVHHWFANKGFNKLFLAAQLTIIDRFIDKLSALYLQQVCIGISLQASEYNQCWFLPADQFNFQSTHHL